jgi:hypothetical protein
MEENQQHHAFYVTDIDGKAVPLPLLASDGVLEAISSRVASRKHTTLKEYVSPLGTHGFPGIPFEGGEPNPTVYKQGEDVILDLFLYYSGRAVNHNNFKIKAVMKSDVHAIEPVWEGELDHGIYITDREGFYELWIPKAVTSDLLAGTYTIGIVIIEPVGTGSGPVDRTVFLLDYSLSIEYGVASPNPESATPNRNSNKRSTGPNTWPNSPNTIGTSFPL